MPLISRTATKTGSRMNTETYSYWHGWKDALAGFPPQAEEHAEPEAYLAGYQDGIERQVDSPLPPQMLRRCVA
jgi:hypothetical protein